MRRSVFVFIALSIGCSASNNDQSAADGGKGSSSHDAGATDSSAARDAATDSSVPAGMAMVTVTGMHGPESGVSVVFQDSSGMPMMSSTTNASGTVTQAVPSGGQVTVVMGSAAAPYLYTAQGVASGDSIAVYDPTGDAAFDGAYVTVDSWPSGAPSGTANVQAAAGSCVGGGASSPPAGDVLAPGCEANGQVPVLLTALTNQAKPLGYTWQKNVVIESDAGAPVGDAGITVHVDVTTPWTTNTQTQTVSATGAPAFAVSPVCNLSLTMITEGVGTPVATDVGGLPAADAGVSAPLSYPAGYADAVQAEATVYSAGMTTTSVTAIATHASTPSGSGTTSLDLGMLLPMMSSASLDTSNAAQPAVKWSAGGSVGSASGVAALVTWTSGTTKGAWMIAAPTSSTTISAPALPSASSSYAPGSGAQFGATPVVALVGASFLSSYQDFRQQAGAARFTSIVAGGYPDGNTNPVVPPLSRDGTAEVSAITASTTGS